MRIRDAVLIIGMVLAFFVAPPLYAQRLLETVTLPESAEQIKIEADYIATWEQSGQQILLLRGNTVVTQGGASIVTPNGVAWVDRDGYEKTRVFRVVVYGENGLAVTYKTSADADYGYIRLATTNGQIGVKTRKGKVLQQDLSSDQGYRRGLANQQENLGLPKLNDAVALTPIVPRKDESVRPAIVTHKVDGIQQANFEVQQGPSPAPAVATAATYFQVQPPATPPGPGQPPPPPAFSPTPPPPPLPNAPGRATPKLSLVPRYKQAPDIQFKPDNGMTAVIVTGGISLLIWSPPTNPGGPPVTLQVEADRAVIWTPGTGRELFGAGDRPDGAEGGAHEVYLSGNVEVRTRTAKEIETLFADEVYIDVRRNVAVARQADLEIQQSAVPYPLHLVSPEIIRENEKFIRINQSSASSSAIPSDPGLRVNVANVTIEERQVQRKGFLGLFPAYDDNGKPIVDTQRIFTGRNIVAELEGVPFFYFPYLRGRVEDPLGPLDNINIMYNRIFGVQLYTTWDMFELLGMTRPAGDRWRLYLDYLSQRGPFIGSEYEFSGYRILGTPARYSGLVKLYGGLDYGMDILGGDRGNQIFWPDANSAYGILHPDYRGQAYGKVNVQELPSGFSVLGQFNFVSDRNFIEQYYPNIWLNELNQDTYLYVKQQQDNWAWSIMGQFVTRDFLTQTDWLPKLDGWILGQTFLDDLIVYNVHGSAGYARLRPTNVVPFAYLPNDVQRDAARFDVWQEASIPFYLGPLKLAPFVAGDFAYYTQDVNGDARGRAYGAGGVRWNLPLSRHFPEIQSDFLNLNTIYHKINLVGAYQFARVSSDPSNFPLFDRLNDDATDQALRDIRPQQSVLNPNNALLLTTQQIYNPQSYIIRRLIDSNVDTFGDINVFQLGLRQRWQTLRGFPGNEHVVDYMTLNVQGSIFPQANRDNFGSTFGILEYDWTWNIGDRFGLSSSGWFDPFQEGPREFEFGASHQRPDGTNFYLGYRQLDPLNSKAVVASVVYPLSPKYAMSANTVWDFGNDVRSYSLVFSRMGTDILINAGLNFNSTVNTFGVVFEVLPNLARRSGRAAQMFPLAPTNLDPMVNVK